MGGRSEASIEIKEAAAVRDEAGRWDAVSPMIDLSCDKCTSNRLDIPVTAGDDGAVIREKCGNVLGSLAEVEARVEQAVLRGQDGGGR